MTVVDYSKYPDAEKRQPREHFTRVLQRFCARLDSRGEADVTFLDSTRSLVQGCRARVLRLWVVGSYARGAQTCGDLDLVMECEALGGRLPGGPVLRQAFLGSPARVSLYKGTPEENESGVPFPEAVLVWEPGRDWRTELEGIEASVAGRYFREADLIPLRREQLAGMTWDAIPDFVKRSVTGHLKWTFVPLSGLSPVHETRFADEWDVMHQLRSLRSSKKKLVPLMLGLARKMRYERGIPDSPKTEKGAAYAMRLGGVRFYLEEAPFTHVDFDDLSTTCIAFIPKLTTRGPNGFWVIERGEEHPVSKAFRTARAWLPCESEGLPVVNWYDLPDVEGVQVHSSKSGAQEAVDDFNEGERGRDCEVRELRGSKLLEALAGSDLVACPDLGGFFAQTPDGHRHLHKSRRLRELGMAKSISVWTLLDVLRPH